MTLQRCQNCQRLTVADFCSGCFAGMAGGQVDREYLYVLQHEETRLGTQALLGPVREQVSVLNAQSAHEAMRADPRYLGPMETWPQPEGMRNMTPEERAEAEGGAGHNAAPHFIEEGFARRWTAIRARRLSRRLARLRRWLRGAP